MRDKSDGFKIVFVLAIKLLGEVKESMLGLLERYKTKGMRGNKAMQKWLDVKTEIENIVSLVKQEIKRIKPFVKGN